jgi:hypothetical protein
LNGKVFGVVRGDHSNLNLPSYFQLWLYNPQSGDFTTPQLDVPATYIGGGTISVRNNFSIVSKKFNFLEEGQNIQLGFLDVLFDQTEDGAVTLNVYLDYNDSDPINRYPENVEQITNTADTFFNSVVPTTQDGGITTTKTWKRVICPVRGQFFTLEWTFSNAQMVGDEQKSDVQIDAQILWIRKAGRHLPVGF